MLSARPAVPSCSTVCSPLVFSLPLHSRGHPYVLPLPPTPHRNLLPSLSCSCSPSSSALPSTATPPPVSAPPSTATPPPDSSPPSIATLPPVVSGPAAKRRMRYRKAYPGEGKGITEEMRFIAMRLRNEKAGRGGGGGDANEETWKPTVEGYLKYLVDSRIVFATIEDIVDRSDDVAYTYFRKTGLERAEGLSKDLEYFTRVGVSLPEPSSPGTTYAAYLEEIAGKSVSSFLSHFYNIYFAHISGGQVIGKQVSEQILDGRELEFYKWPSDALGLLKNVREALNKLGEHWPRLEKNQCLRETTKCFRMSGRIVRLITLESR